MKDFEFKSEEFERFKRKIYEDSDALIKKMIKENSPIKLDEDVKVFEYRDEIQMLRVSKIEVWAISSWGCQGDRLSFDYHGLPLKKNGEPMKNRKPIWFNCFEKDGKRYHMPSYSRIKVIRAHMNNDE